ncbi:MAG: trypsin-like peptidase domain-containing protein [Fluviicola sp.]|nr:trypsin-like peptidase domain-containing protein [Fluviicola sp.]
MPLKQRVTIATTNENSKVYADNEEIGRGNQFSLKIEKTRYKQIVLQTPGYQDENIVMKPLKKSPLAYGLLLLDIPAIITIYAFSEDKTFVYSKEMKFENTNKLEKRLENQKYINISNISLNIKDKDQDIQEYLISSKGDINEKMRLAVEERKNNPVELINQNKDQKKRMLEEKQIKTNDLQFSSSIYKILKKTEYYDTINNVFQNNSNTLQIAGEIRKVDFFKFYIGTKTDNFYKIGLDIKWLLKNSYGETIDSVNIYEYSGEFSPRYAGKEYNLIFKDAVDRSYFKLRKSDVFLKNIEMNFDFAINYDKLTISEPKAVVKDVDDAKLASVLIKRKDKGHGSGFAISNDGYILTNFHVIAGETIDKLESVKVVLSNGQELDAKVVRYNRYRDIALLKVEYQFEKAFLLKTTKEFKNLQQIYTIGAPKSVSLEQTISMGLISNERKINNYNVLQLSISINSGNSGGPLFDKTGLLHGVIHSKLVGYATEGVGFAIPAYLISEYLNISMTN